MNNKLLLVTCITLLYRQSQLNDGNVMVAEKSSQLVRDILERIKLPEISLGIEGERDIIQGLKNTALMMCNDPVEHRYEVMEVLQTLRMNVREDNISYEALRDGIEVDLDEKTLHRTCRNLERKLNDFLSFEKSQEILQKAAYTAKFEPTKITNWSKYLQELQAQLDPYTVAGDDAKNPAMVDCIDLDNIEDMARVAEQVQKEESGESLLKTGWQGVNRMLSGGMRRGDLVCIAALQHNFKTGFTLNLMKHIALYNKPFMFNAEKKPLILRISFEDTLEKNYEFLYMSLYENETGQRANMQDLTPRQIAEYVRDKMKVNGYNVKMARMKAKQMTYRDICNEVIKYESMGYEIHALVLDYLGLVPAIGCFGGGVAGGDMQDMFARMREFCNTRKITLITPHQISTDAKRNILRVSQTGFVKEMVGKGYYKGCASLDNEFDCEIFIHIEKFNGRSYLTIQRGKQRVNIPLPEEFHHVVLAFHPIGGLRDDFGKADSTLTRVGGSPLGSEEATDDHAWAMDM